MGPPGDDAERFCVISMCWRSKASGDRYPSAECRRLGLQAVLDELEIAEMMLSTCEPVTAKDVLIMAATAFYRIDGIAGVDVEDNRKAVFARDCALVERTFNRVIPALEKLAGMTLKELGIEDYHYGERFASELLAAALGVEAEHTESQA